MTSSSIDHTFVILAYKESKYLEECIKSVLSQSVPSKVLVATSTPNDYIGELAQKYGLNVMTNTNSGSIGKDWNFGYRCADTRYVTIAHQDDIYLPLFAEKLLTPLRKNDSSTPLMAFNKSIVYKGGQEINISFKNVLRWLLIFPFHFKHCISNKFLKKTILLFSNSISCPGVMYVKENLKDFEFDEEAKYILDWKAWYDISKMNGAMIYVSDALHIHREHEESATSTTQLETLQSEELQLLYTIWGNRFIAKLITRLLTLAK